MTADLVRRVESLIELDRFDEALTLLAPAMATTPDDPELHRMRARALLGRGDGTGAARAAQVAVGLQPQDAEAHRLRSLGLSNAGFGGFAIGPAREAVRLDSANAWNHYALAVALFGDERLPEAWDTADRAARMAPFEAEMFVLIAQVTASYLSPGDAASYYREALRLDPSNAVALNNLAVIDGSVSTTGSIRAFRAALAADPSMPEARLNLEHSALRLLLLTSLATYLVMLLGFGAYAFGHPWIGVTALGMVLLVTGTLWLLVPGSSRRIVVELVRSDRKLRMIVLAHGAFLLACAITLAALLYIPDNLVPPVPAVLLLGPVAYLLGKWTTDRVDERSA